MSTLKTYKSYVFRDKDPVIDFMRTAVKDSGLSYVEIHANSGVAASTLHSWFEGTTKRPQFATVNAVARSLGKEFMLVNIGAKRQLKVVR
jgi:hypothetical protein